MCGAWDKQAVSTPEAAQAATCPPSLTSPATALHSCSLLRPGQQKLGRSKALGLLEKFPFFQVSLKKSKPCSKTERETLSHT